MDALVDEGSGWADEDAQAASSQKQKQAAASAASESAAQGEEEGAWELELDNTALPELAKPTVEGPPSVTLPREAPPAQSLWLNSEVPADHVAAGSFETAMKLLNAQLGIVNFAPLKPYFLSIASTATTLLAAMPATSALEVPLLRNWATAQPGAVASQSLAASAGPKEQGLPIISLPFSALVEKLQAGYRAFTSGKFPDALDGLRSILHMLPLLAAGSTTEAAEAKELIGIVVEYILGLQIELKRKEVAATDPSQVARIAELSAYFTHCNLQPAHVQLTLRSAMNNAVKLKNFGAAYNFGRRLLDLAPKPEIAQTTQRVLQLCEQNALRDEFTIDYDERNPFVICAASFKPIYRGTPTSTCPYCGSHFQQEFNGSVCTICTIAKIGAPASGLTLIKPIAAPRRPQKRSLMDE